MANKTITINGISGEVPLHVAEAYEAEQKARFDSAGEVKAKLAAATTETADQRARADSLAADLAKEKDKAAKLDAALKEAQSPKAVSAAVAARVELITAATKLLGRKDAKEAKLDSLTDDQVREAALKGRVAVKLDTIPEEQRAFYLRARFDEEVRRDAERDDARDPDGDERLDDRGDEEPDERADADEEPPDDEEDEEPTPAPRADSRVREPRRVRSDSARSREDRADPKAKHEKHLFDLGREPLPNARKKK